MFPVWPDITARIVPVRRATLARFPFSIAFELHDDFVLVLALAHAKQQPLYWRRRMR